MLILFLHGHVLVPTAWTVANPENVTRLFVYSEMKKEATLRMWDPLCFKFATLWPHGLSLFKMSQPPLSWAISKERISDLSMGKVSHKVYEEILVKTSRFIFFNYIHIITIHTQI